MCDTGCSASCVSQSFAEKLRLFITPVTEKIKLVSANKSVIENVDVNVCIQGLTIPYTFCVLRDLSHPVILGCDFFRHTQAIINVGKRSISMYENLICAPLTTQNDKHSVLKLFQNVVIPPLTETLVKIIVPHKHRNKPCLVETFEPLKNKHLLVASTLIEPRDNTSFCRIANFSNEERHLAQGTSIASISSVDITDSDNRWLLSINQQLPSKTTCTDKHPLNHDEKVIHLRKLGLKLDNDNLTPDQFRRMVELLFEYREIFCSELQDLPLTNLKPYSIRLKPDVKPIRLRRYPLPPIQERILEEYTTRLLQAGVLEESDSAWHSPAIIIKKHKQTSNVGFVDVTDEKFNISNYRLVVDWRAVNDVILNEYQPLTDAQTIFTQVAETHPKFFSAWDISNSFYQVNLAPESRDITSFSTKTRHVRFCRAGQGL